MNLIEHINYNPEEKVVEFENLGYRINVFKEGQVIRFESLEDKYPEILMLGTTFYVNIPSTDGLDKDQLTEHMETLNLTRQTIKTAEEIVKGLGWFNF